jgi:hypothetical protein
MKKIMLMIAVLIFTVGVTTQGQTQEAKSSKLKNDQSNLANDFYVSYGIGTLYYFIDNEGMSANTVSGTFLVGFARSINKVIAVGFQLSYARIGRTGMDYGYYPNYNYYNIDMTDNMWQGIANIRFRYLNTPTFSMYSGIGMGVTMDYYSKTDSTTTIKGQKLLPAGQLTLLGFRVGRALSFFGEFGIGTNSILNAGVSYKFGD